MVQYRVTRNKWDKICGAKLWATTRLFKPWCKLQTCEKQGPIIRKFYVCKSNSFQVTLYQSMYLENLAILSNVFGIITVGVTCHLLRAVCLADLNEELVLSLHEKCASVSWRMDHPRALNAARSFLKTRVYSKHSAAAVQTRDQARGSCGFVSSVVWSEVSREGFFRCQFFIVQFEIVWILPHTLQQGQFVPTGYCKWLWLRVKQTPTVAFYWVIQNFHFLHTVCVLSFLLLCTVSQSVFPIGFNGEMEFWKMTWECHWNWS